MASHTNPVRRLRPPDRRAPVKVQARSCPMGRGCVCCPAYTSKYRGAANEKCQLDHPAEARLCQPPIPERIPACAERAWMNQDPLPAVDGWTPPRHECCVECGRITARRWTRPEDGRVMPWCAGAEVEPPEMTTEGGRRNYIGGTEDPILTGGPKKRRARYNPALLRHSWTKTAVHWRSCDWCGIRVHNQPDPNTPRWFQEWDWPDQPEAGTHDNRRGGSVPTCPGPKE